MGSNCDTDHEITAKASLDCAEARLTFRKNANPLALGARLCSPAQVDPQHVWVLFVPALLVAPWVPALLSVKEAQLESPVCGAFMGVAVITKLLAVGTAIVTV